ncbi:MAG: glycoside hydrolase family 27 protein [Prevotella sp.]|nr:glycoside hydrolase family 27 protein [Prevotella sp.]MDD7189794.1 glycoside hydrolase family 27 protein [Prevotella sp.]MDY5313515.1 glycoside hydrolase family 27 protein [Prevotella sp.]
MTQITLNNMRRVFFFIAVVAMMATSAFAQQPTATTERGKLAPTPPMGWMTWNMFKGDISEQLIKETADAMVESGLRDAGYKYVFIDDLWQGGRDNRNNIIPDPKKFPNGIKALADYVHSKGLKLGIYSDAAQLTCGGCTASYGFEEQDARTFASWGVDYLKYDYCNAPEDSATARLRYKTMADALSKSGRDIVLGICEWGQRNGEEWCEHVGGQLWRTSSDVRDMWKDIVNQGGVGILDIINVTAPLSKQVRHGQWPDMDMLVVGLNGKGGPSSDLGGVGCTYTEYQTQMSMWCMMSSVLALSNDLRHLTPEDKRILLNKEIIAIDQDPLGKAAERVVNEAGHQVFVRPLANGSHAVAILNSGDKAQRLSVSFKQLGLTGKYTVRDVWQHRDIARGATKWGGKVQAHETKVFVLR